MTPDLATFPKELLVADPVLPLPSRDVVLAAVRAEKLADLEKLLRDRVEAIRLRSADPLRYGYEPPTYADARALLAEYDELLLMGGNREGKTDCAAKLVMETLCNNAKAIVACFHSQEKSSKLQQQPRIHAMMPPEWRDIATRSSRAKGKGGSYLSFQAGTGFTNDQFILPNGALCLFFNYGQAVKVMEGYEFDFVWFDEDAPLAFLEALTFRLSRNRHLKTLITFTPVRGGVPVVTPLVMDFLKGMRILKTRSAAPLLPANEVLVKDCPPGHMPYVIKGGRPKSAILFFHNGMNLLGGGKQVLGKLEGASADIIKVRAFGWPTRQVGAFFSRFCSDHVLTAKRWEEISKGPGTYYVVADPRPGKNWFIKRYFVTPEGWSIVCWEWPDVDRHEGWALPPSDGVEGSARFAWRAGPAQFADAGKGTITYKEIILKAEGWKWDEKKGAWDGANAIKIERRLIDRRGGGIEVPSQEEGTSIIALMEEENKDPQGRVIGPPMYWDRAPGGDIGEGLNMIVNAMDYDANRPVNALNCPKWYVVETCRQSIVCYQEFTGAGGEKDALKDPVDCDRYFMKAECGYVAPKAMRVRGGGFW